MKCEICHNNEAETAIGTDGDGEELYVCKACAQAEQLKRKKRRERTRKAQESAVHGSQMPEGTEQALDAFVSAMSGVVEDLQKVVRRHEEEQARAKKQSERKFTPLTGVKIAAPYMMRGGLHLEGLNLIGEIDAVCRGVSAMGLRLKGIYADGVSDVGNVYRLCHCNEEAKARRVLNALIEQERNARIRLYEEMPRVFADSLCRALAILKNCRLLAEGEYFDLLSPLRLAAMEDMLVGIKTREIERMMKSMKLEQNAGPYPPTPEERETLDADRADEANRRFEDVVIND